MESTEVLDYIYIYIYNIIITSLSLSLIYIYIHTYMFMYSHYIVIAFGDDGGPGELLRRDLQVSPGGRSVPDRYRVYNVDCMYVYVYVYEYEYEYEHV